MMRPCRLKGENSNAWSKWNSGGNGGYSGNSGWKKSDSWSNWPLAGISWNLEVVAICVCIWEVKPFAHRNHSEPQMFVDS